MDNLILQSLLFDQLCTENDLYIIMLLRFLQEDYCEMLANFTLISQIPHIRIADYSEDWLPQYLDYDFFQLTRLTRETFEKLLLDISGRDLNKPYRGGEEAICAEKMLLMTLWWLGKGEVLLSVSDKFNVSVSTVYKATETVLAKIVSLKDRYIFWPNNIECVQIEEDFRQRSGFPGVIGAIDVCNIRFKPPAAQQESYIDRKLQHSIKLQGICIPQKIFTSILVGYAGSVHDSRILQHSDIYIQTEMNHRDKYLFNQNRHLVGDSAYPLMNWIMTPYRDNGNLTRRQRSYNNAHSRTRIVIEHTFGLLKTRWRILNSINVNSVEKTVSIITGCCILHNFCYINNDVWQNFQPYHEDFDNQPQNLVAQLQANNKRNTIAENF